jgi:ADP-ribose pyrophosphatase YjhB (NUDIX family)
VTTDRLVQGRIRLAAYARCRDEAGRVLLCHLAPSVGLGDLWTLPGGGLQFGESPEVGVLRELAEETGYRGVVERLLRGWRAARRARRVH